MKRVLSGFHSKILDADCNIFLDQGSRSVNRIQNVVRLRESQFPEDAGPMAHPVRPESYIEINVRSSCKVLVRLEHGHEKSQIDA